VILSQIVQTVTQARAEYEAKYARRKQVEEASPETEATQPEGTPREIVPAPMEAGTPA
jgi:hypothetical protein